MRGTMMGFPLTLGPILERAGDLFADIEVVSRGPDRTLHRSTYAAIRRRSRALAAGLRRAGLAPGDRVASLMWNHASHLEAYFGVPAAGGVLHTLNPRLHPPQIAYAVNHARGRFLIVDQALLSTYESFKADVCFERVFVTSADPATVGKYECYEDLLGGPADEVDDARPDEDDAALLCFTSGTTGNCKGVAYSHRALVLHAFALALPDSLGISQRDVVMPATPMFHAAAWGVPFAAPMAGARLVFPGRHLDPQSLLDLLAEQRVTIGVGVPTVWIGILDQLEKHPGRWTIQPGLRAFCGGTAPPEQLIRSLDRHAIELIHGYGLTESTPLVSVSRLRPHMKGWPPERQYAVRAWQGRAVPFVQMRIMTAGASAPHDGTTPGEIELRGPWIAGSYYNCPDSADRWTADGWFKTGDVGTIDPEGYLHIVDRAKDLIKCGGEWISSIDLENALMAHPAVREAAVIAVPHPKWQERPFAVIVAKENARVNGHELRRFLAGKFATWQLPDDFVFVNEIPRTSVGKFCKSELRKQYAQQQPPAPSENADSMSVVVSQPK